MRLFKALRDQRWLIWATVFLVLSTHAIIDAMTVYGTRIFWPVYPDPVGVGSVFIIDPVYSLPLLAVVIWALCKKTWSNRLRNGLAAALVFSTAYLGLSVAVQKHVEGKALQAFRSVGAPPERIIAIAAPFNILVWKVVGLYEDRYSNLYVSLLDNGTPPEIYVHPRHPELTGCLRDTEAFEKLNWFSRGFYRTDLVEGKVVMSDLRMGLTPGYVFRFAIGEAQGAEVTPITPERVSGLVQIEDEDWNWLKSRLGGAPHVRQAEAELSAPIVTASQHSCSLNPSDAG